MDWKQELVDKGRHKGFNYGVVKNEIDDGPMSHSTNPEKWYCGYVEIPKGHELYRLEIDLLPDLEVHGGVTYAGENITGLEGWQIGFDCRHWGDDPEVQDAYYTKLQCYKLVGEILKNHKYWHEMDYEEFLDKRIKILEKQFQINRNEIEPERLKKMIRKYDDLSRRLKKYRVWKKNYENKNK